MGVREWGASQKTKHRSISSGHSRSAALCRAVTWPQGKPETPAVLVPLFLPSSFQKDPAVGPPGSRVFRRRRKRDRTPRIGGGTILILNG